MRSILFLLFLSALISCNNGAGTSSGLPADLQGYETETLGTVTKAIKRGPSGDVIEEGYISNGKKNGIWITFYEGDSKDKVKTIASYSDGILNGPYYELSNRGQIETEVNYANNMYNGKFATYKYGRTVNSSNYVDNKLHGLLQEFDNKGKIQKEVNYKNGVQHGIMRYYNPEGQVSLEYEYKDGEKVSGGMVETK